VLRIRPFSSWLSSSVGDDDDGDVSAGCLSVCHQTFGFLQELTVPDLPSAGCTADTHFW
jgi:hypothetical protein